MSSEPQCPIEGVTVNENKSRVVAALVLALTISYMVYDQWFIICFLLIDFSFRASNEAQYSPLGIIANSLVKYLKIINRPVDRAPKRFAAGVGALFAIAILFASFSSWPTAVLVLSLILAIFALLEAGFGFCAGCYVYDFLRKISTMLTRTRHI